MGNFFCRLFAPWKAEGCFDELDDFYDFLLRRNRALNAVRVLFFAAAAVCLMLGYAFEPQPYNAVAVQIINSKQRKRPASRRALQFAKDPRRVSPRRAK